MNTLTQERLKELLNYNPENGVFTWKVDRRRVFKGDVAGYIEKCSGCRIIVIDKKLYKAARLAFLSEQGFFPSGRVGHKNKIKDDDRFCNLKKIDGVVENLDLDIPHDKAIYDALEAANLL